MSVSWEGMRGSFYISYISSFAISSIKIQSSLDGTVHRHSAYRGIIIIIIGKRWSSLKYLHEQRKRTIYMGKNRVHCARRNESSESMEIPCRNRKKRKDAGRIDVTRAPAQVARKQRSNVWIRMPDF